MRKSGPEAAKLEEAFLAELAALNVQRLFWLLWVGLLVRVLVLVVNRYSVASSALLATMQWFDIAAILPLIAIAWRLRRPGASTRLSWMLILFVVWATPCQGVVQALASAADMGYRSIYIFLLMTTAVAYVIPPLLILPAYAVLHTIYVVALLTGNYDPHFRLTALSDGTLGVTFAGMTSWLFYRGKRQDFLKTRTIAAQNRELARRHGEMTDLMAIAAHDLRSPLQGLDRVLELAGQLVDPAAARLKQALEEGRESCRRMLSLVTRLLDAHAAEHRRSHAGKSRCDAAEAFRDAGQRHEAEARDRKVVLQVALPGGAAEVAMEAEALEQVLDNLVGNALKHAPAGTVVELVLTEDAAGAWIGEVRDQGRGVPAEEQPELFGKFRRGTNGGDGGEAGFGLGLFIVRQLLVAAGGDVAYADRVPRGAVFRMTLPGVR